MFFHRKIYTFAYEVCMLTDSLSISIATLLWKNNWVTYMCFLWFNTGLCHVSWLKYKMIVKSHFHIWTKSGPHTENLTICQSTLEVNTRNFLLIRCVRLSMWGRPKCVLRQKLYFDIWLAVSLALHKDQQENWLTKPKVTNYYQMWGSVICLLFVWWVQKVSQNNLWLYWKSCAELFLDWKQWLPIVSAGG